MKALKDQTPTEAFNKDMVDRVYGPGVVLIGDEVVGEWKQNSNTFEIDCAMIDSMKLGFAGSSIQEAWSSEMGK